MALLGNSSLNNILCPFKIYKLGLCNCKMELINIIHCTEFLRILIHKESLLGTQLLC